MCIKHSFLSIAGIPAAFGLTLLTVAFILLLAPYFGGMDLKVIVIPAIDPKSKKWLTWFGPMALLLALLLHAPLWPLICPKSCVSVSGSVTSTSAHLYVTNSSNRPIRVIWRTAEGKEDKDLSFVLEPAAPTLSEETFLGHDWCIVDADTHEYIEEVRVTEVEQRIEVR